MKSTFQTIFAPSPHLQDSKVSTLFSILPFTYAGVPSHHRRNAHPIKTCFYEPQSL